MSLNFMSAISNELCLARAPVLKELEAVNRGNIPRRNGV